VKKSPARHVLVDTRIQFRPRVVSFSPRLVRADKDVAERREAALRLASCAGRPTGCRMRFKILPTAFCAAGRGELRRVRAHCCPPPASTWRHRSIPSRDVSGPRRHHECGASWAAVLWGRPSGRGCGRSDSCAAPWVTSTGGFEGRVPPWPWQTRRYPPRAG